MERLTIRSGDTTHENGVCCTHFNSKECHEVSGNCAYGCKWEEEAWSKLCDYEDAEEQGLLLILPVPCGEWVYSAECGYVEPYIVASYSADKHGLWCLNLHGGIIGLWGKSVFATHSEAEKALAELQSK